MDEVALTSLGLALQSSNPAICLIQTKTTPLGRKAVDSYFAAQSIEFVNILGFYRRSVWSFSVIDLSNNIVVGVGAAG